MPTGRAATATAALFADSAGRGRNLAAAMNAGADFSFTLGG